MHELGITQEIVDIVSDRVGGDARVKRIVLEIGKLTAVLPDAIRFCFDTVAEGSPLEGAELVIIETPGKARCRQCGRELVLEQPFGQCDECGNNYDLEWLAGDELRIRELEIL
jgi:hydrogenase nickel incorporation protein HypA/HybF